jgi:hypothetical protein
MGEEVELAAESIGAVVGVLADDSNALGPVREYATYVEARLHLRHLPRLAQRAMAAAEKIRESGLPHRAFEALEEPLVTAILEGMAEETSPDLQPAWENLLANALTDKSSEVRRAFPEILRQLDPKDAQILDGLARATSDTTYLQDELGLDDRDAVSLDNLTALELLRPVYRTPTTVGSITIDPSTIAAYVFNERGWAFVKACRAPGDKFRGET